MDIIDWDETEARERLIPVSGADPTLDAFRARHNELEDILRDAAHMLEDMYGTSETCHMTLRYMPTLGFLVTSPVADGTGATLRPPPSDFELQFEVQQLESEVFPSLGVDHATGVPAAEAADHGGYGGRRVSVRYYKCNVARRLDETYGDLHGAVCDLEDAVARRVETALLDAEIPILTAAQRCAEFDVLLSFVDVARDFGYTKPVMHEDSRSTLLRGARHPLQEQILDSFVANDVFIGPASPHANGVLVITGPNYSGKSVLLKMIGLVSVMAQVGCFVPAERAELGVVDRIFSRIQTQETAHASSMESAFSIDVHQIVTMLRSCTPRSLLLVDEFGKGTVTDDGISLLAATVKFIAQGKAGHASDGRVPRTVITTHYLEMFDNGLLQESASGSSAEGGEALATSIDVCEMQVHLGEGDEDGEPLADRAGSGQTAPGSGATGDASLRSRGITPLFHLAPGRARSSFGLYCARQARVGAGLVARAEELLACFVRNEPVHFSRELEALRMLGSSSEKQRRETVVREFARMCSSGTSVLRDPDSVLRLLDMID